VGDEQLTFDLEYIDFNRIDTNFQRARNSSQAVFRQCGLDKLGAAAMGDAQQRFHKALVQSFSRYNAAQLSL
jgi:hypothetical protein